MKFSKIIYFRYIPLTKKIYDDFYMQQLNDAGFEVEYWDLSAIFSTSNFGQEDSSHLAHTIKFDSYAVLEKAIKVQDVSSTLYISIVTYEGRVTKLFRLLTRYNCIIGVFGRNMFPTQSSNTPRSVWQRILNITPTKLCNYLTNSKAKLLKAIGYIKDYDIIFQGGSKGWLGLGIVNPNEVTKAQIVKVNSDDYDNYLRIKANPRIKEKNYILFLDEYLPLHPDTELIGIKNVSAEEYYPILNSFFDRIEQQFSMPVVVAAHPKSLKYKENDYFNGRQVLFGLSADLSRDAHFVLAHDSTSINYPIAFGVKLHFITSHSIEKSINSVHQNVLMFANYLNCNWQYMDDEQTPIQVIDTVDRNAYNNYKYDFQCWPATENTLTKDIFTSYLESL